MPFNGQDYKYSFFGRDARFAESWQIAGELLAVIAAVKIAIKSNYSKIKIVHDYEGVAKVVDGTYKKLKKPIMFHYRDAMKELMEYIDVEFEWVKSHGDNYYNNMADGLAYNACTYGAILPSVELIQFLTEFKPGNDE
jgi:ribonuclease HI